MQHLRIEKRVRTFPLMRNFVIEIDRVKLISIEKVDIEPASGIPALTL